MTSQEAQGTSAGAGAGPQRIDYLEDDPITVPGQAFALLSVVSPSSNQRADKCGIKIRGVFGSRPEADAHAKKLQRMDPTFDIYLVDMYRWLLVPPDPTQIEDQEYQEELLNTLVKGYRDNQTLAKQHFEERKRMILEEGLDKHLLPHERHLDAPTPVPADAEDAGTPGTSASATAT